MPKISVILPTYNGSKWIEKSVRGVLAQSFSDLELLIIDDGSTDSTKSIIQKISKEDGRIVYIKNENNSGIQKSLNRGLKESNGAYVARIDDDDEWTDKDKLRSQLDFLEGNLDHVLVGTGVVVVDESGKELMRYLLPETDKEIRPRILGKNCFVHSSAMFRKSTAMKFGGYGEGREVLHVEDYDLWLKLGTTGKLANLPSYSVKFTLRPGNISSRNKIDQFKKDLELTQKYRSRYPNYLSSLIRGYLRFWLYGFFNLLPFASLKNSILKCYKEI
jgi:glycosyltransferase involved in cell wall biosynthesis